MPGWSHGSEDGRAQASRLCTKEEPLLKDGHNSELSLLVVRVVLVEDRVTLGNPLTSWSLDSSAVAWGQWLRAIVRIKGRNSCEIVWKITSTLQKQKITIVFSFAAF